MKTRLLIFILIQSISLQATFKQTAALFAGIAKQSQMLAGSVVKRAPQAAPRTEQLLDILEEVDAQYHFDRLAKHYLCDRSLGKVKSRNISVFQALAVHDIGSVRTIFKDGIQELSMEWHYKTQLKIPIKQRRKAFYHFLLTNVFDAHKLPFEIVNPVVPGAIDSFFYFSKTIGAIHADVCYSEKVSFEHRIQELALRLADTDASRGLQPAHKEYLAAVRAHSSHETETHRVLLTADHIRNYHLTLIQAGTEIDTACERLRLQ